MKNYFRLLEIEGYNAVREQVVRRVHNQVSNKGRRQTYGQVWDRVELSIFNKFVRLIAEAQELT